MIKQIQIKKFSYTRYNFLVLLKLADVVMKEFVKFFLFSNERQKKRYFLERLGFYLSETRKKIKDLHGKEVIWIHANAIGEVMASRPLISGIKKRYPHIKVVLSTYNFSADTKASELSEIDISIFYPYDIPFILGRVLDKIHPLGAIILERDYWPNFIKGLKDRGVPVVVASGIYFNTRLFYNIEFTISKEVFEQIDCFCMQTEKDAREMLSTVANPNKVLLTGNLKFDNSFSFIDPAERDNLLRLFNIQETDKVVVAGSIHPEEEGFLLDAFQKLLQSVPHILMIIAPRFIERAKDIARLADERNIKYVKRTQLKDRCRTEERLIILDTMGELSRLYSLSTIALVGGSMMPHLGKSFAGHNIIEPAFYEKATIFGRYIDNFRSIADELLRRQAAVCIDTPDRIADILSELLTDESRLKEMGRQAAGFISENQRVTEKTLEAISKILFNGFDFGHRLCAPSSSQRIFDTYFPFLPDRARNFYFFRLLKKNSFPELVHIELTNVCNAHCIMCPREKMTRPLGFMDMAMFKKITDECSKNNLVKEVHINGFGESTLDKSIVEKTDYLKTRGIKKVYFVTNASALTPDVSNGLIKAGLDGIKFSFYGASKYNYERVHRNLKFEEVENNILQFLSLRKMHAKKKPFVRLQFIAQPENITDRELFYEKWKDMIDKSCGDTICEFYLHNWIDGKDYHPVKNAKGGVRSCGLPFRDIQILWNGDVTTCCYDFNGKLKLGNTSNEDIDTIWNSAPYEKIRQIHRAREFDKIPICSHCDQLIENEQKIY